MNGLAYGSRGEGLGDPNGDPAVDDFVRANAGGCGPKPGGIEGVAVEGRGDEFAEVGVAARCIQGAGDRERM
jgi:hypothetical protein